MTHDTTHAADRRKTRSGPTLLLAAMLATGALWTVVPVAGPASVEAGSPTVGHTRIVAEAPAPWYIEGITTIGDHVFAGSGWGVTGTGAAVTSFGEPSRIFEYDVNDGTLVRTILIEGEDTTMEHGIAGLKTDASGRLYAAVGQLGIVRFTAGPAGWTQELYAALPDLPMCTPLSSAPCSPTPGDRAPLGNDMMWGPDGSLYVSDSFQATIWRIPPGATVDDRAAQIWYQHASLDRLFGPNGMRIGPTGDRLFLAVCCVDSVGIGPIDRASRIVTLPFPDPTGAEPADFFRLGDVGEGADGIEFGASGLLYILSNLANVLYIVGPDGNLVQRIGNEDLSGEGTFDVPASLVFRDETRSILVANYAFVDVAHQNHNILEVYVDDVALPTAPAIVP